MEALGIDIKFLMAQLINFGVFAFVFAKFMYKPFKTYLADQQKDEYEKERLLHDLQVKELSLAEKEKEHIAAARMKAAEIIKEAEVVAEKKRTEILAKAHDEAQALKKKAQKEAEEAESQIHDELRAKVIHTSEVMTETVLKDYLSEKNQADILKQIFAKLHASKVYEN